MKRDANCFPNHEQTLLLTAGLCVPEKALLAWHTYCGEVDIQALDVASTSLLPLVFRHIQFDAGHPAEFQACKSMYRHTWSDNNVRLYQLKKIVDAFYQEKIPCCLLKGAALILNNYQDAGSRVMGDIDILVRENQLKKAISLLEALKFFPESAIRDENIHHSHAQSFYSRDGFVIDLHWRVFVASGFDQRFSNYTYKSVPLKKNQFDLQVDILCQEDQLLHVIVHGLHYSYVPLIRWIPDAHFILKNNDHFDWNYFFSQAKNMDMFFFVQKALHFLHEHQFAHIPRHVIETISHYVPRRDEVRYFKFVTTAALTDFSYPFRLMWYHHLRNSTSKNKIVVSLTLPRFLKDFWRFKSWFFFCLFLGKRVMGRVKLSWTLLR